VFTITVQAGGPAGGISAWSILAADLVAAAVIGGYLLTSHPGVWTAIREGGDVDARL